jgi:hypothetical protein
MNASYDPPAPEGSASAPLEREALARQLGHRSGKDCLDWLLAQPDAGALVRQLPEQDLYWLVKEAGPDESLPLLAAASPEQWQHLLDLEIWSKDRIDLEAVGRWLQRLIQADAPRVIEWFFSEEGELFAYAYLAQLVDVFIPEPDAPHLVPAGYSSLDGVHYVFVRNPDLRPALEKLLRILAVRDPVRYAGFLETLAGLVPGEAEEELYRFRNARLAEKGFLPFEEAAAVYAPLDPERLRGAPLLPTSRVDAEIRVQAPLLPLARGGGDSLLARVAARLDDPLLLDRLRLEWATVANHVLSAEGPAGLELSDFLAACQRVFGYVSVALDATAGGDPGQAEELLRRHHVLALFRAGSGTVMRLKWDLERWRRASWFRRRNLQDGFWGGKWESLLAGLQRTRPLHWSKESGQAAYRDFACASEVEACRMELRRLGLLDRLLERLTGKAAAEPGYLRREGATFHPLCFNGWARVFRGAEFSLEALELQDARTFLASWQAAVQNASDGGRAVATGFVETVASHLSDLDEEDAALLRDTLSRLYREFVEEYAGVAPPGPRPPLLAPVGDPLS